ncbi:MAG: hypothetical protein NUV54_01165 [Candidatus Taylorbacteria bacterium]|nr:hypothetical protein [Candidatus Taylorbacteria bacterium]
MKDDDPVLAQEGGFVVTGTDSSLFANIPQKSIEVVAAYLQLTVDLSSDKDMNVLNIFNNARAIFTDDYIKGSDIYWKEHLAGTLREPFDRGFEANLFNAIKTLPKREDSQEAANFFKEIGEIKTFLNDLAHLRYPKALLYIQGKDPGVQEITDQVFDRTCKDLVELLYKWFSKHCYKGTN